MTSCSVAHPIFHKELFKPGHGFLDTSALRGLQNDRIQVACGALPAKQFTRDHRLAKCYEASPQVSSRLLLIFAMSHHSCRCEYQTEYVLRSNIKRRIGKKGVMSEQKQTFEVPLRRVIDIEVVNVDPVTGQQRKERVSRVVGLAREEKTKRLVSSPEGDSWVEEVKLVPATRHMKVDLKEWELFYVRSIHGMVGDLETVS